MQKKTSKQAKYTLRDLEMFDVKPIVAVITLPCLLTVKRKIDSM